MRHELYISNLEMEHENYCREVDNYKYFVLDENNRILCGYESKFDAIDYIECEGMEDEFKVYTKRYLISQGYDVEETLNYWKRM